ncbi:hypothetical protein [Flavobacterium sp. GT3R68]|uniref:hypothetical protein n=1 Tax=Flavobacterium sp. GT3R68 TaxID=2594437 RepID=UPI000F85ED2F|nr:hypothetical protein [Flavobacterium sp. GT3R68]RTY95187.1 hypothetical protein EKL32_07085 [Flavobacterium sp. GSN2]TRW91070.1 hypothetical protein FNW07_09580 [Flavobacterium sp. GT3R68]
MEPCQNYIAINKELWNKKTPIHFESDFYDIKGFINGNCSLNDIELTLLGDISGKTILHLQCHYHSISEVLNSLTKNNLEINSLDEFDYSPYCCFNETIEIAPKKYRIKHLDNKIPMVYTIVATKKHQ